MGKVRPGSGGNSTRSVGKSGLRTVVRGAWLFDGLTATLRADPVVVLEGGSIIALASQGDLPRDADVIDLAGTTLLPGLVDTHVHLAFDATANPAASLADRDEEQLLDAMTNAARTAAHGGVTTVRDLGDRDYLSLRLTDRPGLPTIVCAGPPITTPGGHCYFLGGAAAPGPDGMRAAVRDHIDRGVQVIKIMASGGWMTPGSHEDQPQFTLRELRTAVEEAHRGGLPVTAHVHSTTAIRNAVTAGMDGLEHVTFWTADSVDDAPADLIAEIVRQRTPVGAAAGFAPAGVGLEPGAAARVPLIIANMVRLMQAGAVIVAGTDAGVHPTKPHDVLSLGIAQLMEVGMPPLQALQSATSGGAEICGLGDRKGRLSPGYDADLLAVDGDPLTDPAALQRVRGVWVRGVRVR